MHNFLIMYSYGNGSVKVSHENLALHSLAKTPIHYQRTDGGFRK